MPRAASCFSAELVQSWPVIGQEAMRTCKTELNSGCHHGEPNSLSSYGLVGRWHQSVTIHSLFLYIHK